MSDQIETGMALRDYFAAKAVQSLIVHYGTNLKAAVSASHPELAEQAYQIADAMLVAREMK